MLKQLHFYSSPGLKWDSFSLSMFVYLPRLIFLEYLCYIFFYDTLCWNMWACKFWLRCLYLFWNDWSPGCCAQPLLLVYTSEAYNVVRIGCCGLQISDFIFSVVGLPWNVKWQWRCSAAWILFYSALVYQCQRRKCYIRKTASVYFFRFSLSQLHFWKRQLSCF